MPTYPFSKNYNSIRYEKFMADYMSFKWDKISEFFEEENNDFRYSLEEILVCKILSYKSVKEVRTI